MCRHSSGITAKLAEALLKKPEVLLKSENLHKSRYLRILNIELDTESGTVWRDGVITDLPDLSFRLLAALAAEAPAMVSKDDLIAKVWGDVVVSDETLMQRVRLLRQALSKDSQKHEFITAVRGRGYRLVAPVTVILDPMRQSRPPRRWLPAAALLAIVIAVATTLVTLDRRQNEPAPSTISSLAVLPFDDLSEDGAFGFFADGMHEELIARLVSLKDVTVLSRTSVERFRDSTESIPEISEVLGADGLIEGSIRVNGNRIRITVQLIDGMEDKHFWADTYEEELTVENIFAIQERVADSIAKALQVEYQRQKTNALGLPTKDVDAYNLFLLGRYQTYRQTPENLDLAVGFLKRATELDSEFAEAYTALGWAYAFQGTGYGRSDPRTVYPLAREAALRALEIDDRLADAHSLYGDILAWYDWEFQLAEVEYRRAMALDPLNVLGYALFLSSQSRHEEAMGLVNTRLNAAPDDDYVRINAGWNFLRASRYNDAIEMAMAVEDHPDARSLLGFAYLYSGESESALAAFEDDLRSQGRGQNQVGNLALAHFRANNLEIARQLLAELLEQDDSAFVSPILLAAIYFASGDEARGYEFLESSVEMRERGVMFLNVNPLYQEQRDDSRFVEILAGVGFGTN